VVELPSGPVALATRDVEFETLPMTLRQKVAHFLGNPNILFVLVALGALGIYAEFHNPGMVVPGIVGGIALLAAAVGLSMIPFNTGGLLLVLFGFVLFALEIWIPSYGALTIGGILSLVLGGILLFDVNEMDIGIDIGVLASVPLIAAAFALLAGWLVVRSHRAQVQTGPEGIVGEEGEVTRGGDGRGWVKVAGEIWKARWNGSLEAGDRVRVLEMYDLELRVERFEAGRPS
jgi:membrane-bound serine protease (ClpP class)